MKRLSAALTLVALSGVVLGAQSRPGSWQTVWSAAPTWRPAAVAASPTPNTPPVVPQTPLAPAAAAAAPAPPAPIQFNNQTLRQIVRVTSGGDTFRVVFSNAFGTAPIELGAANVALRDQEAAIVAASSRPLRFAGQPSATIPAGAILTSDPVDLRLDPLTDVAIDLFLPGDTGTWGSPLSTHPVASQTSYVSATGNHAGETVFPPITTTLSWYLLSRIEMLGDSSRATIVAVGDSITDGTRSTPNTNNRWPDHLARRLQADAGTRHLSVANAAISGNRLISEFTPQFGINLLARFDRDVLAVPGARFVIVLEGINDIGMRGQTQGPTAAALIAAHQQVIERAHARGLKIFGATLTPFEGAGYFTPDGEVKRQAVNEWIRTSKWYDGVVDFDAAVRDPQQPLRMLPAYDSGDHLHPNDAGYKVMGESVDLALFK